MPLDSVIANMGRRLIDGTRGIIAGTTSSLGHGTANGTTINSTAGQDSEPPTPPSQNSSSLDSRMSRIEAALEILLLSNRSPVPELNINLGEQPDDVRSQLPPPRLGSRPDQSPSPRLLHRREQSHSPRLHGRQDMLPGQGVSPSSSQVSEARSALQGSSLDKHIYKMQRSKEKVIQLKDGENWGNL